MKKLTKVLSVLFVLLISGVFYFGVTKLNAKEKKSDFYCPPPCDIICYKMVTDDGSWLEEGDYTEL